MASRRGGGPCTDGGRYGRSRLRGPSSTSRPAYIDADAVGEVGHHGKIVRDVNESAVARIAQAGDRVEHPHLRGDVEPGRRLVKDDNVRPAHQRHHQDNALLLAARELVRIAGEKSVSGRQHHRFHELAYAPALP